MNNGTPTTHHRPRNHVPSTPAEIAAAIRCDESRVVAASAFAERILMALAQGNYSQVKSIVATAEAEMETVAAPIATRTLLDIGVPVRTCNMLDESMGIMHVEDLRGWRTERALAITNFGCKSVDQVWLALLGAVLPDKGKRED